MLRVAVNNYEEAKDCPLRNVLDQLGDKWSFLILAVLEDSPKRFNEIKRQVGGISPGRLPSKLRGLEREGYLSRTVHPVRPPHVEYELTRLGRSLLKPINQF